MAIDTYLDLGGAVFNVKAYGATGNGSMDDRQKIQDAITAASGAGGGIVFFPAGSYRINAALTLPADVTLAGASTFRYSATSNINFHGTGAAVLVTNERAAMRGLRLANLGGNGTVGVDTQGNISLEFERVEVSGFATGFKADGSFWVTWRRCILQGTGAPGSTGISSTLNFNHCLVENCTFIAAGTAAWRPIDINRNATNTVSSSGSVIRDNDFSGGPASSGSSGPDFYCIDLGPYCQGFLVTGNRLESSGMGFLRQANYAQGLTITGNELAGAQSAVMPRGIEINGWGVEIGLNTWANATVAIRLTSTATRVIVEPQEVITQVATILQNDSRQDLALRTYYNDRTDAFSNLGTTPQPVRDGAFLPQRSVTHFSLVTPQGHSGTFSVYTGLESGVGYRYTAVGAANCTVTQSTPAQLTITVQGSSATYTLAYDTGNNVASLRAGATVSGTTLLASHLIPIG